MEKPNHIVIIPSPGAFSHLLSLVEFSKSLIQHSKHLHITCLIPSLGSPSEPSKSILQTLPPTIHATFLPPIHPKDLPQDTSMVVNFKLVMARSLPFIRDALNSLNSTLKIVAIIADLFASDTLVCAKELNILSFLYFPTSATTLSFCFYLPILDQTVSGQFRDLPEPIEIPGCVPIHGRDLLTRVQDRTSKMYELFLQTCKQVYLADGVLVNSFKEIEAGPIRELTEEKSGYPCVYPIGPIIQSGSSDVKNNGYECLKWLDKQVKSKSVLYVSFGSGGTLSQEQLNELAFGLELSGVKFLWVVRAPSNIPYSPSLNAGIDPLQFLPSGFLDRTKEQGLVVPSWAPQVQVLSHNAIGGFLSHCGWNSILESVMNGVPIIAWPLFAEQAMNAVMLSEGLKVAIRVQADENGWVKRGEVAEVVRRLMEGEEGSEIGRRMEKLKNTAAETLKEEGSSTKTIIQFVDHLMSN